MRLATSAEAQTNRDDAGLPIRSLLLHRLAKIPLDQSNAGLTAQLMGCAAALQDATGLPTVPAERARWETHPG